MNPDLRARWPFSAAGHLPPRKPRQERTQHLLAQAGRVAGWYAPRFRQSNRPAIPSSRIAVSARADFAPAIDAACARCPEYFARGGPVHVRARRLARIRRAPRSGASVRQKTPDRCKPSRRRDNKTGPSRLPLRRIPIGWNPGKAPASCGDTASPLVAAEAPSTFSAYRRAQTTQTAPAASPRRHAQGRLFGRRPGPQRGGTSSAEQSEEVGLEDKTESRLPGLRIHRGDPLRLGFRHRVSISWFCPPFARKDGSTRWLHTCVQK